jgi:hypothetical protein
LAHWNWAARFVEKPMALAVPMPNSMVAPQRHWQTEH